MTETMRHACGQLIKVDILQSHGEVIPDFFEYRTGEPIISCPNCETVLDIDWCGKPWLLSPMSETMARHTMVNKYCSNCWSGDFELVPAKDMSNEYIGVYVVCVNCREETIGYVSDQYILREQSEDYIHYRRDAQAISKALGLEAPVFRTQAENLKSLGF